MILQYTENVTPRLERLIAFDRQFEGEVSDSTIWVTYVKFDPARLRAGTFSRDFLPARMQSARVLAYLICMTIPYKFDRKVHALITLGHYIDVNIYIEYRLKDIVYKEYIKLAIDLKIPNLCYSIGQCD